jgi:RNA polymerase sigma-70 factor (ECF subfamily)
MTDLDVHLQEIVKGDKAAFGGWVAGAEATLRGSLRSFAASVDVEAVVQETLLRSWQVAGRVQPDAKPNSLLRFALRVGRNLALSEARRRRVLPATNDDEGFERLMAFIADEGPAPADPFLRRAIQICLSLLPGKPREAIQARLKASGWESDQAIANRLGLKLNTLLQNVTRARRALAECLKGRGIALEEELP